MQFIVSSYNQWASLVAQVVKNLSAMRETRVQSLSQEGPLEKGMATQSSILAWRIPWTEGPDEPRVGHDWATDTLRPLCFFGFGINITVWLPQYKLNHVLLCDDFSQPIKSTFLLDWRIIMVFVNSYYFVS